MTTPAEYRRYADECLRSIWIARVPEVRVLLLSMAKLWIEIAEREEEQARQAPGAEESTLPFERKPPALGVSRQSPARQAS